MKGLPSFKVTANFPGFKRVGEEDIDNECAFSTGSLINFSPLPLPPQNRSSFLFRNMGKHSWRISSPDRSAFSNLSIQWQEKGTRERKDCDAHMKSEDAGVIGCNMLLFKKNQVQIPALAFLLTTVTLSPENLTPSSGSLGNPKTHASKTPIHIF